MHSSEVSGKKYTNIWAYNLDNHFIYKPYSSVQVLQIMCLTRVKKQKNKPNRKPKITNLFQTRKKKKKKNLTDNKKLQRECTASPENCYKHNTGYNSCEQVNIWTFTVSNSD